MTDVNKLITENIDVWTSAIKKRNATGRGSSKKIELTGVKKLRELILELAVRGKLVPQDANDDPASVLLARIAEEKVQLIADKKIKKQKPLAVITDDEKQFKIPRRWEWCRLGDFGEVKGGKRLPKGHTLLSTKTDHAYIRVTDMKNGSVNLQGLQYLSSDTQELISQYTISKEDLYITIAGTIGEIGSIPVELDGMNLTENAAKIVFRQIELVWLKQSLSSNFAMNQFMGKMNQLAQPKLALHRILSSVIALPPLAEQQRIVAKVDELMALCDQLEQKTEQSLAAHKTLVEVLVAALTNSDSANDFQTSWQRIAEQFDVLFTTELSIEQLKQTILQLAVMGKLVPQNPSDEPASVLLEKIAEEKAQLIAEKKIKKQKELPDITNEEKRFELPVGWASCRLAELIPQFQNGASSRGDNDGKDIIVLRLADIKKWEVSLADTRSIVINEKSIERYVLKKDDVLIIRVNGSADIVGRFITCRQNMDAIYCDHFIRMRFPIKCFSSSYLSLLGSSSLIRERISDLFVSTAGQKTVNQTHIGSLTVTLPPLAEQKRIVTKVDELMALCEQLKARLSDAQTTQLHLADAVVENALAK
jgi:type I restriction enzyme S subunit